MLAVSNISQFGGRYREEPIYVGDHRPPHFKDVPNEMDRFFSVIHENWTIMDDPTTLPAYALWRLNWIHPFVEGNGRTARAACYYLICARSGGLLGGRKIVPERIRENRSPYYGALQAADRGWEMGNLDSPRWKTTSLAWCKSSLRTIMVCRMKAVRRQTCQFKTESLPSYSPPV